MTQYYHVSMKLLTMVAFAAIASCLHTGCVLFTSTSSNQGNKYQYAYKLTAPVESNNMVFRDEFIYVQFRIDDAVVKFQIQNVSPDPLEIVWSRASIGIRGRFFAVRNSDNLYTDSLSCSLAATIPPLGYSTDLVIPARNIRYDGSRWSEQDLLPTTDHNSPEIAEKIQQLVGTPVTLMLPVRLGDSVKDYQFTFSVTSVVQIPWEKHKLPWRPAPPARRKDPMTLDQMITAGVVVGVVAIASYWLTLKKVQPGP